MTAIVTGTGTAAAIPAATIATVMVAVMTGIGTAIEITATTTRATLTGTVPTALVHPRPLGIANTTVSASGLLQSQLGPRLRRPLLQLQSALFPSLLQLPRPQAGLQRRILRT